MSELKAALSTQNVTSHTVYFNVTEDTHISHLTGNGAAGFSQRVSENVAEKILELVAEGITEVRRLLRHYVMHDLCRENSRNPSDRAYFPIDNGHVYMAKRTLQLSCLDRENLHLTIDEWKLSDPESTHFFVHT